MIPADRIVEVLRQFAFVGAVLGGFGFAYTGAMLAAARDNRAAAWSAAVGVVASVVLVLATFVATAGSIHVLMNAATEYPAPPGPVGTLWMPLVWGLYLGAVFLFISLGLSGFVRSRRLGAATAGAAALGLAGLIALYVAF